MYSFLLSFAVVAFISLCFFKKKFWENRYLVLFIGGCVAIVATLTTNYIVRNNLPTHTEMVAKKSIEIFHVADSMLVNDVPFIGDKDWSFVDDFNPVFPYDTIEKGNLMVSTIVVEKKRATIFFYNMDKCGFQKVGFFRENGKKVYRYLEDIFIVPSPNDSTAFLARIRQNYERDSKWFTEFSLPRKNTITCLFVPPTEYAQIPDSLINKPPFVVKYN